MNLYQFRHGAMELRLQRGNILFPVIGIGKAGDQQVPRSFRRKTIFFGQCPARVVIRVKSGAAIVHLDRPRYIEILWCSTIAQQPLPGMLSPAEVLS